MAELRSLAEEAVGAVAGQVVARHGRGRGVSGKAPYEAPHEAPYEALYKASYEAPYEAPHPTPAAQSGQGV